MLVVLNKFDVYAQGREEFSIVRLGKESTVVAAFGRHDHNDVFDIGSFDLHCGALPLGGAVGSAEKSIRAYLTK